MTLTLERRHALLCGRVAWRDVAKGKPSWLCSELVATAPAQARLAEWIEAGGLDAPDADWRDLRDRLVYVGDAEILGIVARVLGRIAPPARDYVLASTWVMGVGWSTNGWTSIAPPRDVNTATPRLIVLSGAAVNDKDIATVLAHECAHAWLLEGPSLDSGSARPHSNARQALESLVALSETWRQPSALDRVIERAERAERQAANLTSAWGFVGAAADAQLCAREVRRHIVSSARAVTQVHWESCKA